MFLVDIEFRSGERRHYEGAAVDVVKPDWIEVVLNNDVPESEGDRLYIPMDTIKMITERETLYQKKARY
jgi:hypothetical protein